MISSLKASLLPAFVRPDAPSRETLRRSMARDRASSKGEIERPRLVLASASPRRLTLLAQVGVAPDALRPASIDESAQRGEMPRALVSRLARAKAEMARDQIANDRDLADSRVGVHWTVSHPRTIRSTAPRRRILGSCGDRAQPAKPKWPSAQ